MQIAATRMLNGVTIPPRAWVSVLPRDRHWLGAARPCCTEGQYSLCPAVNSASSEPGNEEIGDLLFLLVFEKNQEIWGERSDGSVAEFNVAA